jgi:predicted ATPase/class 3 adenylate cyclase
MERPRGTITFLFSDIEGSTRRWETGRAAMQDAVRRHDDLMHAVMLKHGGFVFKTVGDAFCVAFADPRSALEAALEAQRLMAAENFDAVDGMSVRMGLHSGSAEERAGDYFGPTVNRVARISAAAHGGQIVLSAIAAELVRADLPPGISLRDLGEYELKDLAAPERIFQVCGQDLAAAHPALRVSGHAPANLPVMLTSFVGRERELSELRTAIAQQRLVSIVGTGGAGKTRLAIALATSLAERFPGGVWFVDLAPLTSGTVVLDEFAAVLGVRATSAPELIERLASKLRERETLIVVDNCEHVIEDAAGAISELLVRCSDLRIIATSRESLRIAGEHVFATPPLDVPPAALSIVTAREALTYSSVALFAERAAAAGGFHISDANASAVVDICRHLDGLPFALELAAPRLSVLAPAALLARLGERLRLLKNEQRGGASRTQTLSALIEWSYDLLTPPEQALFRTLCMFAGSFSLESAALAAGTDGLETIDLISSLVEKSMVVREASGSDARFRLFESTRAFAQDRLLEHGERDATMLRFCAAMLTAVTELLGAFPAGQERAWLDSVELELDNVRAALVETLELGRDAVTGAEIAVSLGIFWHARRPQEGSYWLSLARDAARDYSELLEARVFLESARIELTTANTVPFAQRSVAAFRSAGDRQGLGHALEYLGQSLINVGRFEEAGRALDESVGLLAAENLRVASARSRVLRGVATLYARRDDAEAERDLSGALTELEADGRKRDASMALQGLTHVELARGNYREASAYAARGLHYCEELNHVRGMALLRYELAHSLLRDGAADEARANALEALRLLRDTSIPMAFTQATVVLAATLAAGGRDAEAARAIGYARFHTDGVAFCMLPPTQRLYDETLALLRSRRDDAELEAAMRQGEALAPDALARTFLEENALRATSLEPSLK